MTYSSQTSPAAGFGRLFRFLLLLLALTGILRPQSDQEKRVISQVAQYLQADEQGDVLSAAFAKFESFQPPNPEAWRSFPIQRKIHEAYLACERAEPRSGGRFLALLSRDLAQLYDAARHDALLKPMLEGGGAAAGSIRFEFSATGATIDAISPEHRRILLRLAEYAAADPSGGAYGVLRHRFRLSDDAAYSILATSANDEEALQRGLQQVDPARRELVLKGLIDETRRWSDAARFDAVLDAFHRDPMHSSPSGKPFDPPGGDGRRWGHGGPDMPSPPGSGGGPPGGGKPGSGPFVTPDFRPNVAPPKPADAAGVIRRSAESFVKFSARHYAQPSARSFRVMVRSAGGFGGVVFGNAVTSELPHAPTALTWQPSRSHPQFGQLRLHLTDGSCATLASVRHEDVAAAVGLLAECELGAKFDDGFGLVGISDAVPWFELGETDFVREGRQFRVLMHPAVASLDLGWAALMVDVLPITRTHLRRMVTDTQGEGALATLDSWLDAAPGTWKFVDREFAVRLADGGALEVAPKDGKPGNIDVIGFALDDEVAPEFGLAFTGALPTILAASEDYRRISDFAPVFALCRWAHQQGIAVAGLEPAKAAGKSVPCESIIITDGGWAPCGAMDADGIRERQIKDLEVKCSEVTKALASLADKVEEPFRADARLLASFLGTIEEYGLKYYERSRSLEARVQADRWSLMTSGLHGLSAEEAKELKLVSEDVDVALQRFLLEEDDAKGRVAFLGLRRVQERAAHMVEAAEAKIRSSSAYPLRGVERFLGAWGYRERMRQLRSLIED